MTVAVILALIAISCALGVRNLLLERELATVTERLAAATERAAVLATTRAEHTETAAAVALAATPVAGAPN